MFTISIQGTTLRAAIVDFGGEDYRLIKHGKLKIVSLCLCLFNVFTKSSAYRLFPK